VNARRVAKLKARLLERRQELVQEGSIRAEPTRTDDAQVGLDEDAQPLAEMSQSIASARNRARSEDLLRIDRALARLEKEPDVFGLCLQCEEAIAEKRLEVSPWVELCVDCQAKRDAPRGGNRRHAGDFVD
jgi:DnaK suppressor protein